MLLRPTVRASKSKSSYDIISFFLVLRRCKYKGNILYVQEKFYFLGVYISPHCLRHCTGGVGLCYIILYGGLILYCKIVLKRVHGGGTQKNLRRIGGRCRRFKTY